MNAASVENSLCDEFRNRNDQPGFQRGDCVFDGRTNGLDGQYHSDVDDIFLNALRADLLDEQGKPCIRSKQLDASKSRTEKFRGVSEIDNRAVRHKAPPAFQPTRGGYAVFFLESFESSARETMSRRNNLTTAFEYRTNVGRPTHRYHSNLNRTVPLSCPADNQRTNTAMSARDTQLGTPKHKLKIKSSICARTFLSVPPTCLAISGRVKFSTGAPDSSPAFFCRDAGNWRQFRYAQHSETAAPSFHAMGAHGTRSIENHLLRAAPTAFARLRH